MPVSAATPPAERQMALLCAAGLVAYCSYALCRTPILPLFAQHLGAGPAVVGLVVGASTITGIFVKLPAGALSDVVGRRPLLMAGAFIFAMMPFAYVLIGSVAALAAVRFVHGNATAVFGPVASATVSDLAPANRRGSWLATYATAQGVGQALGPLLGGYLLAGGRFDLAFAAAGAIGIAVPILVSRIATAPVEARRGSAWRTMRTGLGEVTGDPQLLLTSVAHAGQFVLNGALNAFLPLYARDVLGLTTAEVGWLFAAQTVTTLSVRPIVGRVSDTIGRRGAIASGLAMSSAMVALMSIASGGSALAACTMFYAAGVATTSAAASAHITDLARRAHYGAAHGVFGTIYDIGDALGPVGAGLLVAAVGYEWMFRAAAALGFATAAVFFSVCFRIGPEKVGGAARI